MIGVILEFLFRIVEPFLPKYMRAGFYRVIILHKDNSLQAGYIKPVENAFSVAGMRYEVHQGQIYRQGRFRTPTLFYEYNVANPRALRDEDKTDALSATENFERMESHVAREALSSLDNDMLSGRMPAIIILGAIGILGIAGYYQMSEITAALDALIASTATTVSATGR